MSKQLLPHHPFFKVENDGLAHLTWKGNDLSCTKLDSASNYEGADLVVVKYRPGARKCHQIVIGCFVSAENGMLTLNIDNPEIKAEQANWSIAMSQVIGVYNIEAISRTRNSLEKEG